MDGMPANLSSSLTELANPTVGWSQSGSPWFVLCLLHGVRYFIKQTKKSSSMRRKPKGSALLYP